MIYLEEHKQSLTDEDILVVRRNLETKGVIEVPTETIRRQWNLMYKKHFLEKTIQVSVMLFFVHPRH